MNNKLYQVVGVTALLTLLLSTAGCLTLGRNTLFLNADREYQLGNYTAARTIVENNKSEFYRDQDQVLYHLEAGMLSFYNQSAADAIGHLEKAEQLIEEYYTKSITQAAGSWLINDLQVDYSGEDFEDIYCNIFKALSYLQLGDKDAAFVEVRRTNTKLDLLEDKYLPLTQAYNQSNDASGVSITTGSSRFYNSALASYLSLLMYRAAENYDGVRIDWQRLQEAFTRQPELYPFAIPFTDAITLPQDRTRLSILAFTGRSPVKLTSTLWIQTQENRVYITAASEHDQIGQTLSQYLDFEFPGIKAGYRFKFEIPRMETQGSDVHRIQVVANGRVLGELGLLEDLQRITLDTFSIREPLILLRSAARTIIKGIASEAAGSSIEKVGAESGSLLLEILGYVGRKAVETATEISEQADLRVSRYFPAFVHAGEWDLLPGEYEVQIKYYGIQGLLYTDDLGKIVLGSNKNNLNLITSVFSR